MNIYQQSGYANRGEYLRNLAADYGVDDYVVFGLAGLLGPSEDFDGLPAMVEDAAEYFGEQS